MTELPTGTVTYLFTDIEGSTRLLQELGEGYGEVLERHRRIIREAADRHGGVEFGTEGDAVFLVFRLAPAAVEAAVEVQRRLFEGERDGPRVSVRIGVHTGEGFLRDGDYVGLDVHRVARITAAGHGGQIVLSDATRALVEGHLPPGAGLRDLGEHLLKDLNRAERLYQLDLEGLPARFPPLRTLGAPAGNLPPQLTRFVGRDDELEGALHLLGESRLVTLTGPGGTGKTRLALELGERGRSRFPGGVWFVPLASITDPGLVPTAIAEALELPEIRGDSRPPLQRVMDHLREREVLLVVDNFEQVVPAAPVLTDLLLAAPRLKVVVTSRAVLRVSGEREFPVPPLRLPDAGGPVDLGVLRASEAVALFVDRARAVKPDFDLTTDNAAAVAEICARLDGLPLAIELAAARVRLLSPEAMLARLQDRLSLLDRGPRDRPARQQTLRNAIAWSYDLLSGGERRLFARMGVFMGGCLLEEAEQVCGPAQEVEMDVLDGLTSLAEKSLMVLREGQGEARFAMLETIREFALERLGELGEADTLRARHARAYLALAERAEPELTRRGGRRWLDRLEPEHDNVRAALSWATTGGHSEVALRLVAALWRFWQMRGHLREGRLWAERALSLPSAAEHPRELARAGIAAGSIAYWQLDYEGLARFYEDALRVAEGLDDRALLAEALYNGVWALWLTGPDAWTRETPPEAVERMRRSRALFEENGDLAGIARAEWNLGNMELAAGRLDPARRHLETSLSLSREVGDAFTEGWSLYMLGGAERDDGRHGEAAGRYREALRVFAEMEDLAGILFQLEGLAAAAMRLGQVERAVRLAAAASSLRASTGTELYDITEDARVMETTRPLSEEEIARARSEGEAMTLDQAVAYALEEEG